MVVPLLFQYLQGSCSHRQIQILQPGHLSCLVEVGPWLKITAFSSITQATLLSHPDSHAHISLPLPTPSPTHTCYSLFLEQPHTHPDFFQLPLNSPQAKKTPSGLSFPISSLLEAVFDAPCPVLHRIPSFGTQVLSTFTLTLLGVSNQRDLLRCLWPPWSG